MQAPRTYIKYNFFPNKLKHLVGLLNFLWGALENLKVGIIKLGEE